MKTVETKSEGSVDPLYNIKLNDTDALSMDDSNASEDVRLAHGAAKGDRLDQAKVTSRVHRLVDRVNGKLCKRHCQNNRHEYACTIDPKWGRPSATHHYCDYGNASYAWVMHDLIGPGRLANYQGRNGARLEWYLNKIVGSVPFRERWRNWRFGRQTRIPAYLDDIDPDAGRVFRWMLDEEELGNMSQRLGRDERSVGEIRRKITVELVKRGRLHILAKQKIVSLTGLREVLDESGEDGGGQTQADIISLDPSPEELEMGRKLWQAWEKLDVAERFVLEEMCLNGTDAKRVLAALVRLNISIKEGVSPAETTCQQLYYFRRKCSEKLLGMLGSELALQQ